MPDDENKIIKQYQTLIRALIPYEQENRLLEGLNRFSKRIPSNVRKVVRDEVVRLTSLTNASADNSAFAQFPVFKFKHFGIDMRLDKVGAHILKSESSLYQNRYTVGVFESITNSDFYQSHIKKEQYKKIVDAFAVESQSLNDIEFGQDIAVAPNFQVAAAEFEKGRHFTVAALSHQHLAVESKRPPRIEKDKVFQFALPEVFGSNNKDTLVSYQVDKVCFNKDSEKYETHFKLVNDTAGSHADQITRYVRNAMYQQPLSRELEIERAMQDLERDRILLHSPWVPVALKSQGTTLEPVMALFTSTNSLHNSGYSSLEAFSGRANFAALTDELRTFGEAFMLSGKVKTKQGSIHIQATHRQLQAANVFTPLLFLLVKDPDFRCYHCRLTPVDDMHKQVAFATHDISRHDHPDLSALSHLLFYTDITARIGALALTEPCQLGPVHKSLWADTQRRKINFVVEDGLDRRQEPRYVIDKPSSVRLGLLQSMEARLTDISAHGMRLYLAQPPASSRVSGQIKVTVPDFKIKNEKYQVIQYHEPTGLLRLRLAEGARSEQAIAQLLETNASYFRSRDTTRQQRLMHRFVWELAMREHPSASVLCIASRFLLERIKTVYMREASEDLYPFAMQTDLAPLHGFFADQGQTKPKSTLLQNLLKGKQSQSSVIHCQRKSDNKLVFVPEKDYLFKPLRQHIAQHLAEEKTELCVTRIQVKKCLDAVGPMTKKRLAQLSKVDKVMYERMLSLQASYTHVIYLSNESALQAALVGARLKPVPPKTTAAAKPARQPVAQ